MHDLIHDLAQSIIGSEVIILRNDITNIPKEIRHVSLFEGVNPIIKALKGKPIRTFVGHPSYWGYDSSTVTEVLPSFKSLRVLSVHPLIVEKVSKCFDKLSHLRYLDLSYCNFEVPPNAITRLKNLQTLKLNLCQYLKRFPKDIGKLINLRHLENDECYCLTHMPHGIGELALLQSLPLFVAGDERELSRDHKIGSLMELKRLNQIRGGLCIEHLQNVRNVAEVSKGEILKEKKYLQSLRLEWRRWNRDQEGTCDVDDELVMEGLRPHTQLKELFIRGYGGRKFPSWMMNDGLGSLLPNLIKIDIRGCSRCQILPPFSQLPSLQSLELFNMREVEEMKEGSSATNVKFFPALQFLKLKNMPNLKRLWRIELAAEQGPSFPCLSELFLSSCSNLKFSELPPCPCLSQLYINGCSNLTSIQLSSSPSLSEITIDYCDKLISLQLHSSSSLSLSTLRIRHCPNLTSLELPSSPCLSHLDIQYCLDFTSVELHSSPSLSHLDIQGCPILMASLPQEMPSLKTLRVLEIGFCSGLATLPHWIGSLTSLTTLYIYNCRELTSLPEEMHSLKTLQILTISQCSALATLPHSIGSLTSLKELSISDCPELTSLPEEMRSLKNLRMLFIFNCPHLEERCQKETGADWPKISHIPHIITS